MNHTHWPFSQQTFWLVTRGKAQITLIMAHLQQLLQCNAAIGDVISYTFCLTMFPNSKPLRSFWMIFKLEAANGKCIPILQTGEFNFQRRSGKYLTRSSLCVKLILKICSITSNQYFGPFITRKTKKPMQEEVEKREGTLSGCYFCLQVIWGFPLHHWQE